MKPTSMGETGNHCIITAFFPKPISSTESNLAEMNHKSIRLVKKKKKKCYRSGTTR